MKKAGLYIHIPFCLKRCAYCSFVSCENASEALKGGYFKALQKEISSCGGSEYEIQTVYIGGGTPSYVNENYIADTIKCVKNNFNIVKNAEISIEANPGTLTEKKLECYINCGVNRYSIGLQSANDKLLRTIGRAHNCKDYINAVGLLKKYGIKNIGTDIMLGLPEQKLSDVADTLRLILDLEIPHVSAYGLALEKGTRLYDAVKDNSLTLPCDDLSADMYEYVLDTLKNHGIKRYEVSNFSRSGFECRHNINYWKRGGYFGFGAAAHSFINGKRKGNIENINDYINALEKGLSPAKFCDTVTEKEAEFEYIMLGLRLAEGINLDEFQKLYSSCFLTKYSDALKKLKGLLEISNGSVKATNRGFMVLNSVLTEFLE